jgi:hypothetical protein
MDSDIQVEAVRMKDHRTHTSRIRVEDYVAVQSRCAGRRYKLAGRPRVRWVVFVV